MNVCEAAWKEFPSYVDDPFFGRAVVEDAERFTSGPVVAGKGLRPPPPESFEGRQASARRPARVLEHANS
eukprot:14220463-Alexandrium_andersonii.AAC.1